MQHITPFVGLIRSGSACLRDDDPQYVQDWLQENYQIPAHYHPDTQQWLSAEQRAAILLEFLLADHYTALWAFRGGEGTADILPYLQQHEEAIRKARPKLLLGISDTTALLNYFNQYFGWPVAHTPSAVQVARGKVDKESTELTLALLRDTQAAYTLSSLTPLNTAAKQEKTITAKLCGGNLSMMAISVKDIWEVQTENKILILEDVNEKPYQIARYLNYLTRIGLLEKVAAIILGDFMVEGGSDQQQAVLRTLTRFAESCAFPVLQTTAFGHGVRCFPLPFYREIQLKLGQIPELRLK